MYDGHGRGMTHNEESPDDARKASDVNTDKPGSKTQPAGSGDRDEAAIDTSREKLEQAGGGH